MRKVKYKILVPIENFNGERLGSMKLNDDMGNVLEFISGGERCYIGRSRFKRLLKSGIIKEVL